ncbi:MAG: hypothetical protein JNJ54_20775 [Myxococcaceae bacterium]|nr:hypothetical protein [Myxococcaceae bacterium]
MSRFWWAAVLAASLAGCPEGGPPPEAPKPDLTPLAAVPAAPVATLITIEGAVDLERDGGVTRAGAGPVFEGDVVTTGPASRAVLRDSQKRELELGEETRFRVGPKLTNVELSEGEFSFSDEGGAGWGRVRTPFGDVVPGQAGRLRVIDGGLSAEVTLGEFTFFEPDAGAQSVAAGQKVEVLGGEFRFVEAPPKPPVDAPASVALVVERGRPQLKRPGEKRYSPAQPQEALAAGTAFQVPAGSSAHLEGPHVRVSLGAGTSGVSEGSRTAGAQPVVALTKVIGPLTLQFDGKGAGGVELDEVTVAGGNEATVVVTRQGKKRRLEARSGEVALTVKGKATTVKAGEAVLVEGDVVTPAPAVKPGLVVTAGSRVRVHAEVKDLGIVFPDEVNRLQLARDPEFATPLIAGPVGKQVVVPVQGRTPLYYRLFDGQGQAGRQGRIDFPADLSSARDTATRSDTVAETGKKATVVYQSKVPALTFVFTPQPDVKAWRFRLSRAAEIDKAPLVDRRVQEPRLVLESGALEEGEYLWSASALDANGVEKAGARYNKLAVQYDNARTSLLIDHPANGERATAETKASGVAPRQSQLFINGKLVRPDDAGRFSVKVGAVDTVLFRVVTGETEAYWLRRLKR